MNAAQQARIVVVAADAAVDAYHLAALGEKDVLLLEQARAHRAGRRGTPPGSMGQLRAEPGR